MSLAPLPGVVRTVVDHTVRVDAGGLLGVYLSGSAVAGGLRPDSDVDLVVVTRRSLSASERRGLVDLLLQVSGRRATLSPGRPLEVTSLVLGDLVPWRYPPVCDFQYGEWLRDEVVDEGSPGPREDPDVAVLVTSLLEHGEALHGPDVSTLLEPVPGDDLRASVRDGLDPLLDDLVGDERNVLLTLARMIVTLDSGEIVPKDVAVRRVLPSLAPADRAVLSLAMRGYLGQATDDWSSRGAETRGVAERLADRIRASR